MSRPFRAAVVATVLLAAALGAVVTGTALIVTAPASAQVLGPGQPTIPGFSGYVLSDNGELGIGRLPNGKFGVCTDTGGEFPWPGDPTRSMVTNPRTAYALGKYVEAAKTNGRLAAALWWAVGFDFAANSHPDRVLAHVNQLKAENPSVWSDVKALHDKVVADADANAAPPNGYNLSIKVVEGGVERVGVKGGGEWLDGYPIGLQLTGPARFDSTDTKSWTGNTQDHDRAVNWTRTGAGKVVVKATVSGLPARQYERWWGGGNTQRVLVAADLLTASDVDAVGGADDAEFVPLRVVKAAEGSDAAGLVGVSIEVRADSPTGPVTDSHTFAAADLQPDGTISTTFFASPRNCKSGCKFSPQRVYYVAITAEPAGWSPAATVVQARLDDQATTLVAVLNDLRVWTPSLVTQVSSQLALPGEVIHDVVTVRDTGGYAIAGHWQLLGPVPPVAQGESFTCAGVDWSSAAVASSGDFLIAGDGDYTVGAHPVAQSGCYTYVESADGTPQTQPIAQTAPGVPSETSLAAHQPELATQVSAQKVEVGGTLTDAVAVTGTQGATVTGAWRLLGPVAPAGGCQGLVWTGAPVAAEGTFTAAGDGISAVGQTTVTQPGCYTYVESLSPSVTTHAVPWTQPGLVSETAIATRTPQLATQVSEQRAEVGAVINDSVSVSNTGGVQTTGRWRLLGPVSAVERPHGFSCTGVDWAGAPVAAEGTFDVSGDGTLTVGEFTVTAPGCYTYVEELAGTATTEPLPETAPGIPSETTLITRGQVLVTQVSAPPDTEAPEAPEAPAVTGIDAGGGGAADGDKPLLALAALTFLASAAAGGYAVRRRSRGARLE